MRPFAKSSWLFAIRHVPLRLITVLFHVPKPNVVGSNPMSGSTNEAASRIVRRLTEGPNVWARSTLV